MRALIVANGEPPSALLAGQLAGAADLVVAADGGADRALALGLAVDLVVGDFDSVSPAARAALAADCFRRVSDPSTTDLEKAIAAAFDAGAADVDVIGIGGGRPDHALANLSVLVRFRGRGQLVLHDDYFAISRVESWRSLDAPEGTVVSLIAIGECEGVTTSGLRWDLDQATLAFSPRGVHNEVVTSPATVSVRTGDLLLFVGRWIEKHQ